MTIVPIKIRKLLPPKDDLLAAIKTSKLRLKEGDIIAISSKVVSINEGRCVSVSETTKEELIKKEAQLYQPANRFGYQFTITQGMLAGSAGIDLSNGNDHYILWPKNPMRSANRLQRQLQKMYGTRRLGLIITDSTSRPLRRGALGLAIGWSGIEPLYDYRGEKDIFGRKIRVEQANMVDALAAAAVLVMGEGNEQTPLALIRNTPARLFKTRRTKLGWSSFKVALKNDLFAPFLLSVPWKKGKTKR